MALQGPFVVVADSPAVDVVAALRAEGAFPIIEANWADAAAALASVEPEAIVLAEPANEPSHSAALAKALAAAGKKADRAFTPIVARTLMQHAVPTTFGFKVAGWLDAMTRHRERFAAP